MAKSYHRRKELFCKYSFSICKDLANATTQSFQEWGWTPQIPDDFSELKFSKDCTLTTLQTRPWLIPKLNGNRVHRSFISRPTAQN